VGNQEARLTKIPVREGAWSLVISVRSLQVAGRSSNKISIFQIPLVWAGLKSEVRHFVSTVSTPQGMYSVLYTTRFGLDSASLPRDPSKAWNLKGGKRQLLIGSVHRTSARTSSCQEDIRLPHKMSAQTGKQIHSLGLGRFKNPLVFSALPYFFRSAWQHPVPRFST